MISFAPNEDELLARSAIQDFARDVLRPAAAANDRNEAIPDPLLKEIWRAGLTQALLETSSHDDRQGRSRILSCIVLEELGWADAAIAVAGCASMAYVQAILDHGSADQRQRMRSDFSQPQFRLGALLVQEPGFAFDLTTLATQVERDGETYLLRGAKSCLPLAAACRDLLVVARFDGALSAFIVPAGLPGVMVQPPKGTLGLKSLTMTQVCFDNVRLARDMRLGGDAGCDVQRLVDSARIGIGSILTGLARAVMEHIVPYTKSRIAHGSALAQKQSVAFRLADMAIALPSMRWMNWQAASAMEKGRTATREARLAQIHCTEKALWIADEGIQLMGGHGYMRDNPVERWYRDAHTLSLLEGLAGV